MAIDFHSPAVAGTYASRSADTGWLDAISALAPVRGSRVADIGCGGGIYSTALAAAGAASVVGVDFSAQMVRDARQRAASQHLASVRFRQGQATNTGLPTGEMDLVLWRALIHHLPDIPAALTEAHRILRAEGVLLIQDRTAADVFAPPSPTHIRGWFFTCFPHLADVERNRRLRAERLLADLTETGFELQDQHRLAEVRRTYHDVSELRADLLARTGRSLLHELTDQELSELADYICGQVAAARRPGEKLVEVDYWTIWSATARPHTA
ncbi:class I SAM-dependent methyltransferase [Buchananella hordeovulneris]|uniref:class I SAM-dependent methyltransferase n=1 Tax=Buchananella hordeovulneris TaxID=52770 RepID=UPI000F5DDF82|nr:class I SAM-dependent methyltransferase [Buchananella hordeovulneris]RRD45412.1 class I SAM-dependent methyltransferase [Buchananella hordeovulneris]